MRQIGFEVAVKAAAFIFLRGLLYGWPYRRCVCVPFVVSPMGDGVGYLVDGQFVTNEQMKEVLNDE